MTIKEKEKIIKKRYVDEHNNSYKEGLDFEGVMENSCPDGLDFNYDEDCYEGLCEICWREAIEDELMDVKEEYDV